MATEHVMDRSPLARRKYPFPDMEIGDFFTLPALYASLVSISACNQKRAGKRFSVNKIDAETFHCVRQA